MPTGFNAVFGSRFRQQYLHQEGILTHLLFILTTGVDLGPQYEENDDAHSFMTEFAFIPHISPPALANSDNRDRLPRNVSLSSISL